MSIGLTDDKSTLVQVMAWCRKIIQMTSLGQNVLKDYQDGMQRRPWEIIFIETQMCLSEFIMCTIFTQA